MNGSDGVLLDSVILIDHFNGIEAATQYLESVGAAGYISAITRAEVLVGLGPAVRRIAARFLDCFVFLSLDKDISDLAAELRRRHKWALPDAFQAATAQHHGLALATRNTDDFNPKRHPFVIVPYNLA
jgi:predicted nucleic acid-binding protein